MNSFKICCCCHTWHSVLVLTSGVGSDSTALWRLLRLLFRRLVDIALTTFPRGGELIHDWNYPRSNIDIFFRCEKHKKRHVNDQSWNQRELFCNDENSIFRGLFSEASAKENFMGCHVDAYAYDEVRLNIRVVICRSELYVSRNWILRRMIFYFSSVYLIHLLLDFFYISWGIWKSWNPILFAVLSLSGLQQQITENLHKLSIASARMSRLAKLNHSWKKSFMFSEKIYYFGTVKDLQNFVNFTKSWI